MLPTATIRRGVLALALAATLASLSGCSEYESARRAYVAGRHDEAFSSMLALAQQGHPRAQYDVAMMYVQGIGVAKDLKTGFGWMIEAGKAGNVGAMNELGAIYESGVGANQNYPVAFEWYRRAAQADDAIGQFNVGNMYARGLGVMADPVRAWAWYMRAASNGALSGRDRATQLQERMTPEAVAAARELERRLAADPSSD